MTDSHGIETQHVILVAGNCVYLAALAATVYFTRPTLRRGAGALMGGIAVAVLGVGLEMVAHKLEWWRYPLIETSYGPLLIYPAIVLLWAGFALIGWRITRRFGWRGQATFLGVLTLVGTFRDYAVAARFPEMFVMMPGIGPALADAVCWAGTVAFAQAVMRLVAGPIGSDPLAGRPFRTA